MSAIDLMRHTTAVIRCARCGRNHKPLTFVLFRRAPKPWTHWGNCPRTGEPILLRIEGAVPRQRRTR